MSFVLVSADCSCCKPDARTDVYKKLSADGWVRMNEDNMDTSSVWLGPVADGPTDEDAMAETKNKFYSYFNPNCKPSLVFHWSMTQLNKMQTA